MDIGDINLQITEKNDSIQHQQQQENLENNQLSYNFSTSDNAVQLSEAQLQSSAQLIDSKLQPLQLQSSSNTAIKSQKKSCIKPLKQCNVCGIIVKSLRDHMRQHPGELPYRCSLCKRPYLTKLGLNRHMDIQHGIDRYVIFILSKL